MSSMTPRKKPFPISSVLRAVEKSNRAERETTLAQVAASRDPFRVLVATILSLRTKDETTAVASEKLFAVADTPEAILQLGARRLEKLIFPVGFYRTKAKTLGDICKKLLEQFDGRVPADLDTLLEFRGVGRKTANLVVTLGYNLPGICVDIHVHRITNRWGYLCTKDPDRTEIELRKILPRRHWIEINDLLVTFGKTICRPLSPLCTQCPVSKRCRRVGVGRSR